MKIAFVYDAVYPWEKGGAQKRIWELACRLAENHDVHLYGMHYWDGPSVIEREDVTLHGVCEPRELYVDGRRSIPQALYFATKVAVPLLRENFDIIDCQEFPYLPCFTAKAHEIVRDSTLIVTWYEVWDDYWYEYLGKKGIFGKFIEQTTIRLADTIVPISEYIADDLRELGRTGGLEVVENGVDFEGLQEIPKADADWDAIYVGRLSEHKNVDKLLEAVNIVTTRTGREITCGIIGDGPERDRLEKYANELQIEDQIKFLGFVEADEDVIANIKTASVFVLPSIREGFPNTILEANACGIPSIVVNHPENGSTAVVENDETGFVVEPTSDAIADRLDDLLTDTKLRERLSTNAREYGRAHDWSEIVSDLEKVYLNALSEYDH